MRRIDHLQRIIRSRLARLALALVLIGLGAWAFLPYATYRIANSAFVNAELVRVAAPIAGTLTRDLPRQGTYIEQPNSVSLIETLSRDNRHLLQLNRQHAIATERAALARDQVEQIEAANKVLAARVKMYLEGVITRIGFELGEARAEQAGCLSEAHHRSEVVSRMEQLVKGGTASEIRSAETFALLEATTTRCNMAGARVRRLETEFTAAQNGVSLRDGANDAPYSQQQQDRLFLRRQELETKMLEEMLQASQISAELTEERERIDRLSHFQIGLPANHVVWSVAASPGSTVSEGQTVFDLASCSRRFVAVELPEREFERMAIGTIASVRLLGSSGWTEGLVRQVRGSAARSDDRLLAAQVQRTQANSILVEVALPDEKTSVDMSNFCNIGRLADVRFKRGGMAFFDSIDKTIRAFADWLNPPSTSKRVAGR